MIICPHCERETHSAEPHTCQRKMSRRFFFGLLAGGVMAATVPAKAIPAPTQPPWTIPYSYSAARTVSGVWTVTSSEIGEVGDFLEALTGSGGFSDKFKQLVSQVWEHPSGGNVQIAEWR